MTGHPKRLHRIPHLADASKCAATEALAERSLLADLLAFSHSSACPKALLRQFPSIGHAVAAETLQLQALGLSARDIELFQLVGRIACQMAKSAVRDRPMLGNSHALMAYLQTVMGYEQVEQFRILFLDRKNKLISDEVQQRGTVGHAPVYPREVIKRALILNASALIVAHNHPSGDPTPSRDDVEMTRQLKAAAEAVGLDLHDHVVIGHGRHVSFRSSGLL
jgi:DNA repair protein RadC